MMLSLQISLAISDGVSFYQILPLFRVPTCTPNLERQWVIPGSVFFIAPDLITLLHHTPRSIEFTSEVSPACCVPSVSMAPGHPHLLPPCTSVLASAPTASPSIQFFF